MSRPKHLTRGDLAYFAGLTREPLNQLDDIAELADDAFRAAEARGVDVGRDVEALVGRLEDGEAVDDVEALAEIRGELRRLTGRVERGEYRGRDPKVDENRQALAEIRQLKADMGIVPPTEGEEYDDEQQYGE